MNHIGTLGTPRGEKSGDNIFYKTPPHRADDSVRQGG